MSRPARHRAGRFMDMLRTRQIIAALTGVIGAALIIVGIAGGVWPLSIQFIAGVLLVVMAALRLRYLH